MHASLPSFFLKPFTTEYTCAYLEQIGDIDSDENEMQVIFEDDFIPAPVFVVSTLST